MEKKACSNCGAELNTAVAEQVGLCRVCEQIMVDTEEIALREKEEGYEPSTDLSEPPLTDKEFEGFLTQSHRHELGIGLFKKKDAND